MLGDIFFSMGVDSDSLQNGKPASEPWNILRCISPEVAFQVQRSRVSPGPFSSCFRIEMGGLMGTFKKCSFYQTRVRPLP